MCRSPAWLHTGAPARIPAPKKTTPKKLELEAPQPVPCISIALLEARPGGVSPRHRPKVRSEGVARNSALQHRRSRLGVGRTPVPLAPIFVRPMLRAPSRPTAPMCTPKNRTQSAHIGSKSRTISAPDFGLLPSDPRIDPPDRPPRTFQPPRTIPGAAPVPRPDVTVHTQLTGSPSLSTTPEVSWAPRRAGSGAHPTPDSGPTLQEFGRFRPTFSRSWADLA